MATLFRIIPFSLANTIYRARSGVLKLLNVLGTRGSVGLQPDD
jgi:hypothetical protein